MSSRNPILNANYRLQVRTTQTAGQSPPDSQWTVKLDTGPIAQPIIVNNISISTPENQAETIMFSAQDPTAGATITFSIGSQPKQGTLSAIANNSVTYTPKTDFQGIDTFTYQAADQTGLTSAPASVNITVGTPPANILGTMNVINHSTQVTDQQVQQWTTDIQTQVNNDVSKVWGAIVNLVWIPNTQAPAAGNWVCGIFDTTDQPGDLGYHDVGPNGEPLAKVFVTVSKQAGVDIASVMSHEVIESIGDPSTNTIVKGQDSAGRACVMFQELCDAVENDSYTTGSTTVSNFQTKAWFQANSQGPYDQLSKLTKPFSLDSGGYFEISYDNGRTWTQENMARQAEKGAYSKYREMIGDHSRHTLYKKKLEERKKSTFKQN